ncbi:hypothetical protein Tco_1318105 [Tanacetum coccineum]
MIVVPIDCGPHHRFNRDPKSMNRKKSRQRLPVSESHILFLCFHLSNGFERGMGGGGFERRMCLDSSRVYHIYKEKEKKRDDWIKKGMTGSK